MLNTSNSDTPTLSEPASTETLYWQDLTTAEQERYYPVEDPDQAKHYFRHNNRPYYLPDFTRIDYAAYPELQDWTGEYMDSPYSNTLVRMGDEDNVIISTTS